MKEVTFYHVTQRNGFFSLCFVTPLTPCVFGPGTNEEGVTLYNVTLYLFHILSRLCANHDVNFCAVIFYVYFPVSHNDHVMHIALRDINLRLSPVWVELHILSPVTLLKFYFVTSRCGV